MKYAIEWTTKNNETPRFLTEDLDLARTILRTLPTVSNVASVRGGIQVVEVCFAGSNKTYTYLADEVYGEDDKIYVPTPDGREIVCVVGSPIRTKQQLEAICPLERFKTAIGRVPEGNFPF